jgi:hypothetical protein
MLDSDFITCDKKSSPPVLYWCKRPVVVAFLFSLVHVSIFGTSEHRPGIAKVLSSYHYSALTDG